MRAFLAISVEPQAAQRWRGRIQTAVASLRDDDTTVDRVEESPDGWLAFAGTDGDDRLGDPGQPFTVRLSRLLRTRDADVSTTEVGAQLAAEAGLEPAHLATRTTVELERLLPPFAAAHRATAGGPVVVANDWLGYRQLFWWQSDGAAAVSTSARALSGLAGGALDQAGLGAQAMIGWQISDLTPFEGVRSAPPATIATLDGGRVHLRQYIAPVSQDGPPVAVVDAVEEMATILVGWHSSYVDQHPDSVLQLTGGHDSRILLGAIPRHQRPGLHALTLGTEDHPDVVIAAQLSRKYGMVHESHRLDETIPTPAQAHAVSLSAARALECQASPMALAPLLIVESHLGQGHRLSGLGGEVARGFYYAGQPAGAQTSARLVERLARWRIFSNEGVEAAALDDAFQSQARERTLATMTDLFALGDWLRATDGFYLYQRMHRWSASHGTVAAVRRHAVNPMLDRRFIELALAVTPAEKRDSLLLGRLMTRLDPELARIPLDSGLIPARLGTRDVATRVAIARVFARKAAGKVRQRLVSGRRPQLGAAEMADLVLAHWRAEPAAASPLFDMPVLNHQWLKGLLAGDHAAQATTVAFLVNLLAAPV